MAQNINKEISRVGTAMSELISVVNQTKEKTSEVDSSLQERNKYTIREGRRAGN